ncbi:F0F1 ATP synthase subunit gamma [Candidatus Saccharibacteria bacterium]|nr:F0F1 ATP synthase subunit gamma [Candidatus Saccharibacteria bacterium]
MKQTHELIRQKQAMTMLVGLTDVFEGIASMHIAKIKNQVLQAEEFFSELWHMYSQLRVDQSFHFGRGLSEEEIIDKELIIMITAEGGFSGDIDQKLVNILLEQHDPIKQDIIAIGHHGAVQLAQRGVSFKRYLKLPEKDKNFNVNPLVKEVQQYKSTTVYYQTYVSLMVQDVKRINLSVAVQEQGKSAGKSDEFINEQNYIFEPSTFAVVDHLERSMLNIALSQVIFESKLAQYASRFRSMSAANDRADNALAELTTNYNRSLRAVKDERLKETINGRQRARHQS